MNALTHYIEHKNNLRAAFGFELIEQPLTDKAIAELRASLEADASPENISADGELPASAVHARRAFYAEVEAKLDEIDSARFAATG